MMKKSLPIVLAIALIAFIGNTVLAQTFNYPVKGKQGFNLTEKTRDGLHISYNVGQVTLNTIQYRGEEMSEVSINTTDERVSFSCRNSKAGNENEGPGGVGLANTRQRLELIYGNDYTLNIDDGEDIYQVNLDIPFLTPEQTKA